MRKQYNINGSNCALVNCGTSKYHKERSLIKLPTLKDEFQGQWWKDMLNIIKRDRDTDANLNQRIGKDVIHVSERHLTEEELYICKFYVYLAFLHLLLVSALFGRL